jgi:hypothetical protein
MFTMVSNRHFRKKILKELAHNISPKHIMDGKVKIRGMSSVPNTLGRQIGILPVGNPSVRPRRSKPRSLNIPKG